MAIPAHKENRQQPSTPSTNGSSDQGQRALEETLLNSSTADAKRGGPLLDFHEDLKGDLLNTAEDGAVGAVHRKDTDTQGLQEFVDAQS